MRAMTAPSPTPTRRVQLSAEHSSVGARTSTLAPKNRRSQLAPLLTSEKARNDALRTIVESIGYLRQVCGEHRKLAH
jgi:hypothetical protein